MNNVTRRRDVENLPPPLERPWFFCILRQLLLRVNYKRISRVVGEWVEWMGAADNILDTILWKFRFYLMVPRSLRSPSYLFILLMAFFIIEEEAAI